jgi:hypothetical protein
VQCKGGHLACADCRGKRPGNQQQCQKCERGGCFDVRNMAMDAVLSSVRVECPHEGCGRYVTYHKLHDHQSVCPIAPCKCLMPGCGYEGPPPALPNHVITVHPMPVHRIQYGKVLQLQVPMSEPQCLLFAEEEGRMFFVVGDALGMGAPIAVSVVCTERGRPHRRTTGTRCGRTGHRGRLTVGPTPSRWKSR